jgi:hypothetical protein
MDPHSNKRIVVSAAKLAGGVIQVVAEPGVTAWDTDCMMHHGQNIYKTGLLATDRWLKGRGIGFKYYSSLAKISHLLRDKATAVFNSAIALFGTKVAMDHTRRIFPSCIAGRWGSCSAVEKRLVSMGREIVVPVLVHVLSKASTELVPAIADATTLDDISVEENTAYRQKIGRWSRDVLSCVEDRVFWCTLGAVRLIHEPLDHHFAFLQQRLVDVDKNGSHFARSVVWWGPVGAPFGQAAGLSQG